MAKTPASEEECVTFYYCDFMTQSSRSRHDREIPVFVILGVIPLIVVHYDHWSSWVIFYSPPLSKAARCNRSVSHSLSSMFVRVAFMQTS